jgi:PadR family transcriptional regulator, regulatory protein PadR
MWTYVMKLRRSTQTMAVLTEFVHNPQDWKYGYDISRNTDLKSGTLYPILMRLAERKLLETRWETPVAGKPPRHMYKLTATGLRCAREQASSVPKVAFDQPAFSGVKR